MPDDTYLLERDPSRLHRLIEEREYPVASRPRLTPLPEDVRQPVRTVETGRRRAVTATCAPRALTPPGHRIRLGTVSVADLVACYGTPEVRAERQPHHPPEVDLLAAGRRELRRWDRWRRTDRLVAALRRRWHVPHSVRTGARVVAAIGVALVVVVLFGEAS